MFLQLLKAFSLDRDDFTNIFTKMMSGDNMARLETQAYIQDFEETAVSLGHQPNEFTMDYDDIMGSIKRKIPPWVAFEDIATIWFRTDTNVLIFYR